MKDNKKAFKAVVHGRVQGVGFRYSTQSYAQRIRLAGFVKNCYDGTVEVYAEGPEAQILQLKTWPKKGPPGAYVRECSIQDVPYQGLFSRFTIEY